MIQKTEKLRARLRDAEGVLVDAEGISLGQQAVAMQHTALAVGYESGRSERDLTAPRDQVFRVGPNRAAHKSLIACLRECIRHEAGIAMKWRDRVPDAQTRHPRFQPCLGLAALCLSR